MEFTLKVHVASYCDEKRGGCGNSDEVIMEMQKKGQYCSQCGKKTRIMLYKNKIDITCPNGHEYINEDHRHCIVCGKTLNVKDVSTSEETLPENLTCL